MNIEQALTQFNYNPDVNPTELARVIGFSDEEIVKINVYWNPVFNKGWLYLSDELILGELTDKNSKDTLKDFYKHRLLNSAEFIENRDFKKITKDDELVRMDQMVDSSNFPNQKNTSKLGAKKYYAITGACLKKLLMQAKSTKGIAARNYYLKVEDLAVAMKDYILAIKNRELDIISKQLNDERNVLQRIEYFIENTKKLEPDSYIYVATSNNLAQNNKFKIGSVDTKTAKALKARLSTYNARGGGDDEMFYVLIHEVNDAKTLDAFIKKRLSGFKLNKNRELVIMHWSHLEKYMRKFIENYDGETAFINDNIDLYTASVRLAPITLTPIPIPGEIAPTQTLQLTLITGATTQTRTINVTTLTNEAKTELAKTILTEFIQENQNIPDYDYETCKNTLYGSDDEDGSPLQVAWKELSEYLRTKLGLPKSRFKRTEWNHVFKTLTENANGIKYKMRS